MINTCSVSLLYSVIRKTITRQIHVQKHKNKTKKLKRTMYLSIEFYILYMCDKVRELTKLRMGCVKLRLINESLKRT